MTGKQSSARASYEDFYRSHSPRVIAHLLYLGFPRHIADDATQSAMVDVHRNWHKIGKPHLWARKAAEHHAGRVWRKTRNEVPWPDAYDRPVAEDPEIAYVVERHSRLVSLVNELPESLKTVFALHLDDFGTKEISEYTGVSVRVVQKRLKQARELLQSRFVGDGRWEGNR
ncbi:sigma-70 family RNA polymerase sigma factor [Amycolatopsis sp. NPDC049688]|uniref:RNA polymerase sigma factor n=1 Tax=Amycolatopsis sp. NPDC049688 TaxID=3154733 RepID=UPI003432CDBA